MQIYIDKTPDDEISKDRTKNYKEIYYNSERIKLLQG